MQLKARGLYKVVFKTKEYFDMTGRECFYPWVEVRAAICSLVNFIKHMLDHLRNSKSGGALSYSVVDQSVFIHDLQR
jgi:hypothetical protein